MDEAEIRWFLEKDYARLVNAMTILGGSPAAAEDAVQEALGRAWELGERGGRIDSLPAWVAVVSRNLLRDRIRRALAERRARPCRAAAPAAGGRGLPLLPGPRRRRDRRGSGRAGGNRQECAAPGSTESEPSVCLRRLRGGRRCPALTSESERTSTR